MVAPPVAVCYRDANLGSNAAVKWQEEPGWKFLAALKEVAIRELEQEPRSPGRWVSLIRILKQMGRSGEVPEALDRASAALGADPEGRRDFLGVLLRLSAYHRAIPVAEALVAAAPDDAEARRMLERAVIGSDRWSGLQRRALAGTGTPPMAALSINQAWNLADTDSDFRAIAARCRAALADNPIDTDARCFLAHALARTGEAADASAVMAIADLVRIEDLPVPAGYESGEAFRRALAAEIRRNDTLERDPKNKATRGGLQTNGLGLPGEQAVAALVEEIKAAVDRYRDSLDGSGDPFIASAPQTVQLYKWAVIYDATGYQISHRHPPGWLSGVYYVSAPRAADSASYRGSLLLGAPQAKVATPPPWGIHPVEPVPGRIVLFPSFTPHATEPCGTGGERISVAFDVLSAGRAPT
ncbi:hypothetical protein GCM10009087_17600 [Sphingomonas oligophenolica]|uniref:2OG-Fe(II) oxygenase n=1 Tax=Sphingomonas oligophenolica TaxID=301154 RepID=A0ABU9Y5Q0_9SPHN